MLFTHGTGAPARRVLRALSSFLIGGAALSGCDDSVGVLDPRVPFALEIHVSPDSATLVMGDGRVSTITLSVFAEALEAPVVVPPGLEWSSSDTTVAVVNAIGTVFPRRFGTAIIEARVGDAHDETTIVVTR
jgi:hypothetical protein